MGTKIKNPIIIVLLTVVLCGCGIDLIPGNQPSGQENCLLESDQNTTDEKNTEHEDGDDLFLEIVLNNHKEELKRVSEFINAQPNSSYAAVPESINDNVNYLKKHLTELQYINDDDKLLIDKFLYRYRHSEMDDQESNADVFYSEAQALQYADALTAEEKENVIQLAGHKYRTIVSEMYGDENIPVLIWLSYNQNDYKYFTPRIGQKKSTPGKCIVVCAKIEKEIGEGTYMTFSYMKINDSDDWELVNYGY